MSALTGFYESMWRDAARMLSLGFTEVAPGFWRIDGSAGSTLINNYVVQIDDPVTLNLAGDKVLCHRLLSAAGLPVPEHAAYTFGDFERAASFMAQHPASLFVVKPAVGTSGARGVTTQIRTRSECRQASVLASLYSERLLIERWIPGESYRLLFLDGEMIHASRRRGCRVVGDGITAMRALIAEQTRLDAARTSEGSAREIRETLNAQRLDLASVPEPGRSVLVHATAVPPARTSEVRTEFDHDATAEIGPALREQAARAVRAIGSKFAGVDVITTTPDEALETAGGVINEINTTPGLHHHYGLDRPHQGVAPAVRVLARLLGIGAEAEPALAIVAAERTPRVADHGDVSRKPGRPA